HYRLLKVSDLGESNVDHRIGHLIVSSSNPTVGVLAHPGIVDVRIAARANDREEAERLIAPLEAEVRRLLGDHVFARDDETLESVVGGLLRERAATIATCEDLSAGTVADTFQQAAGELFVEGVVAGSDATVERLARTVGHAPPFTDGQALADALAQAVRRMSGAVLGLAVHAVAERGQSAENLGRGETYLALAGDGLGAARQIHSAGRGRPDRRRAAVHALSLVRRALLGLD
ncbi:MAG: CinA family protein, partial [Gemmatimonadetes bacterium]|nr:CinA family protein [Gemmatimonadota bacterium]